MLSGEKVQYLRKKMGLSQEQLADYLNVDQSLISLIENENRNFSIDMAEKMSKLAGINPAQFFTDDVLDLSDAIALDFRSTPFSNDDLLMIAEVNNIVENLRWMNQTISLNGQTKNEEI